MPPPRAASTSPGAAGAPVSSSVARAASIRSTRLPARQRSGPTFRNSASRRTRSSGAGPPGREAAPGWSGSAAGIGEILVPGDRRDSAGSREGSLQSGDARPPDHSLPRCEGRARGQGGAVRGPDGRGRPGGMRRGLRRGRGGRTLSARHHRHLGGAGDRDPHRGTGGGGADRPPSPSAAGCARSPTWTTCCGPAPTRSR